MTLLSQDVEVANDKEDGRSLHITIHKPVYNIHVKTSPPVLNAKFTFDDHIRCMTAKQNLIKGRLKYASICFFISNTLSLSLSLSACRARQAKLSRIASILELELVATTNAQSRSMNMMGGPSQSGSD